MILKAEKVCKTYQNGNKTLQVLENVDLEVQNGEIISIMGPSGSGKSTLLNILGTLDEADSGTVILKGENTAQMSGDQLSYLRNKSIGFVFQFHHLLPEFTAFENVMIPTRFYGNDVGAEKKASELFDYFELSQRKDHYPSQLSGGERLRVAVLRALINDPDLVLADEPTGNLDSKNSIKLLELFTKIQKDLGKSFILTTHNPEVAKIGTRSFYLENCKLELNKG